MGISDLIAAFIRESLDEADGMLELQRSDLAEQFNCVPSQINYVMSTRFTPEHGYIVESRRGGGGYIRIRRVRMDRPTLLQHVISSVGMEIDHASVCAIAGNLFDAGAISREAAQLLQAATGDKALRSAPRMARDTLRADILRQILLQV